MGVFKWMRGGVSVWAADGKYVFSVEFLQCIFGLMEFLLRGILGRGKMMFTAFWLPVICNLSKKFCFSKS